MACRFDDRTPTPCYSPLPRKTVAVRASRHSSLPSTLTPVELGSCLILWEQSLCMPRGGHVLREGAPGAQPPLHTPPSHSPPGSLQCSCFQHQSLRDTLATPSFWFEGVREHGKKTPESMDRELLSCCRRTWVGKVSCWVTHMACCFIRVTLNDRAQGTKFLFWNFTVIAYIKFFLPDYSCPLSLLVSSIQGIGQREYPAIGGGGTDGLHMTKQHSGARWSDMAGSM